MSANVLLNLLNELGKEIKCEACRAFYLFFRNEFNKFNNTRARMLDSIYHIKWSKPTYNPSTTLPPLWDLTLM